MVKISTPYSLPRNRHDVLYEATRLAKTRYGRIALIVLSLWASAAFLVLITTPAKSDALIKVKGADPLLHFPPPQSFEHPTHGEVIKDKTYPHDDAEHPLHWMRQYGPDLQFADKKDCNGNSYMSLYKKFHSEGYVVFESCSLNKGRGNGGIVDQAAEFTKAIETDRVQDAFKFNNAVKEIGADPDTLQFLEYLHAGRRVFPFQSLNFPKGTQQNVHCDLAHFDTLPQRGLMAASWVALEDLKEGSGELIYYPKSHHWGLWDMDELGVRQAMLTSKSEMIDYQTYYEPYLQHAIELAGLERKIAKGMKKGQSLIWAASLLHGGDEVKAEYEHLTRLSQVTHYYFEGADQYWVPRLSNVGANDIYYKCNIPTCKAQNPVFSCADKYIQLWNEPQDMSGMTCPSRGLFG